MSNRYPLVIVCKFIQGEEELGNSPLVTRSKERELLAPGLILLSDPALLPGDPDDP